MPLFDKKKKYQTVRSDYVPLPGTKETLSPSLSDIRYILLCFYNELAIICDFFCQLRCRHNCICLNKILSFYSPSTSSRCDENKTQESSFIVKSYCKNKPKDVPLDYAVIEYVYTSVLSPGPVLTEESKDPFKQLYYIFLNFI